MRNPIIVALDVPNGDDALQLASQLAPVVGAFKIGNELFTREGPAIVREIQARGGQVFLDLKYHDIPNTVARAIEAATSLGVRMLTVHTCGGPAMLQAAERAAQETARARNATPPLVLGVTVLTSLDQSDLAAVGVSGDVASQVERLAKLGAQAGLRGFVCSPLEVARLRHLLPPATELVTPGIRSGQDTRGDQKRTMTPKEALTAGATWLVVGRPICAAPDPRAAAERILAECHA